jgi:hypothetical protein
VEIAAIKTDAAAMVTISSSSEKPFWLTVLEIIISCPDRFL